MWLYDVFMESHSADLKRICRAVSLSTMIMGLPQHGHPQVVWDGVVASCAEGRGWGGCARTRRQTAIDSRRRDAARKPK